MKKIKKYLLSSVFAGVALLTIPMVATSIVSCSSGASNNDSTQTSQQKDFERLKNLEAVQSDYTPLIPDGILMKREGGTLKSVNEYHWVNEDISSHTKGFMYELWYSPSKNELAAAILGPSDNPEYAGKLNITTEVDQSVKIPDENIFLASDSSRRYFKVKIMGVDQFKREVDAEMSSKGLWSPFSMSTTAFAPVKEKVINIDYSNTNLEMFFGYQYSEFNKLLPNTQLNLILPKFLINFDIISSMDYSNLIASSIDFGKCEKIKVLDSHFCDVIGKWTKIILPPNIEKISSASIYYADFDKKTPKWKTEIIGMERVKFFAKSAIWYHNNQEGFFENISYQLNPNAFYYSNSFPSWISVEGGILVDAKNN